MGEDDGKCAVQSADAVEVVVRIALAALVVLVSVPVIDAQQRTDAGTAPLIVGTWRLDAERSHAQVPPDYIEIRQYTQRPDGFLVGLLITGTPQAYHYLQFVAKSDGTDYPEYSDQIVAEMLAAGTPTPRTYAERSIDEYTTEWTDKVNGTVTAHGTKTMSKDRKTLTITVDGSANVRIYNRQ